MQIPDDRKWANVSAIFITESGKLNVKTTDQWVWLCKTMESLNHYQTDKFVTEKLFSDIHSFAIQVEDT